MEESPFLFPLELDTQFLASLDAPLPDTGRVPLESVGDFRGSESCIHCSSSITLMRDGDGNLVCGPCRLYRESHGTDLPTTSTFRCIRCCRITARREKDNDGNDLCNACEFALPFRQPDLYPMSPRITVPSLFKRRQRSSTVDISQSTINSVSKDQYNIGGDQIIFNLSDMSSDSVVSVRSAGVVSTFTSPNASTSDISIHKHTRNASAGSSGAECAAELPNDGQERTRRTRLENEPKRRRELRDGYSELKNELSQSKENPKLPSRSILRQAAAYIRQLKMALEQAKVSLARSEAETARLRRVNESLILGMSDSI